MVLRVSVLVLVVYGGLLLLTYCGFATTPKGFIPSQDMGYLMVSVQLPDAASPSGPARSCEPGMRTRSRCDTPGEASNHPGVGHAHRHRVVDRA